MNALKTVSPDEPNDLREMTDSQLLTTFADCFRITVESLVRAAEILQEWLRRGRALTSLEAIASKWIHRLRLIGTGQLLPTLAFRYSSQPSVLDAFVSMPIDVQKDIVDDKSIPVRVLIDGKKTEAMVLPSKLADTQEQFKQVFAKSHIRDLNEQDLYLRDRQAKDSKPLPSAVGLLKLDEGRMGACYGKAFFSLADLEEAVRQLKKRRPTA